MTLQNKFHIDVQLHIPYMFYQLSYISNREKYNKLCNMCQVILPFKGGEGGEGVLSVSDILLLYLNLELLQQHGTPICHSQAALPCSPTRAFNPLPRNPTKTHVLTVTAFHFYKYSYHF